MPQSHRRSAPLACDLTALSEEQRERRASLLQELRALVQEVVELEHGYALRYRDGPEMVPRIVNLVTLEQLCCPFLTFVLKFVREEKSLWLQVTGESGVKAFMSGSWLL